MEILYSHCCGLDVQKKTITACIITPKGKELKTFGTMTNDLFNLADWIKANGCTHVAMESTGVYWKPIYNILEQYDLKEVLVGRHQRMLISTQLKRIDFLDQEIARLDQEIEEQMRPFEQEIALLDAIPGIGVRSAQVVLACIGTDISRFPSV